MKKRFTMIELLIVVTVIAILVAMLLPMLSRVKKRARRVLCLNNLKQSHIACSQYTVDNNGRFVEPPASDGCAPSLFKSISGYNLTKNYGAYVGDWGVWKCIEFSDLPNIDDPLNTRTRSYSTYFYFVGDNEVRFNGGTIAPASLAKCKNPSGMPFMQDAIGYWKGVTSMIGNHVNSGIRYGKHPDNPSRQMYLTAEPEGACQTFYDGSANWFDFRELSRVTNINSNGNWDGFIYYSP